MPREPSPTVEPAPAPKADVLRAWVAGFKRADGWRRVALALEALLALVAAFFLVRIAVVFVLRVPHPYELEWMEGGVVDHVRVLLSGEALYRKPSLEFTPYIYTPLYYAVSAAVCKVLGIGLLGPRLVSVAALMGSLALIAGFVKRETRDSLAALFACGWFVATYPLTAFWFDLARVDSLALFLALCSVWLARFGRSVPAVLGAGAALCLAFFTKQSAVVFFVPLALFALGRGWRRALIATAAFVVPTVAAVAWANRVSDGWFSYYVFDVPGQHPMNWSRWWGLLVEFFVRPVAVPVLASALVLAVRPAMLAGRARVAAYAAFVLAAMGSGYSGLLHRDGYVNVLIPSYAALAVVAGLGLAWARSRARAERGAGIGVMAGLAALAAFVVLPFAVRGALPTAADVRAGDAMVQSLREQTDPMLMLGTGHFAHAAGHAQGNAHAMALADIFKTREREPKTELREKLVASLRDRKWATVIVDRSFALLPSEVIKAVRENYELKGHVFPDEFARAAWPKVGYASRPSEIWKPRRRRHQ